VPLLDEDSVMDAEQAERNETNPVLSTEIKEANKVTGDAMVT